MYTFKDVKKFIENAPVDDHGYHSMNFDSLARHVHIYNSKNECNIIASGSIPDEGLPIGKLYFDDEEVSMIRVDNGYANYDDVTYIPVECLVENDMVFRGMCIEAFGRNGNLICDTIIQMAIIGNQFYGGMNYV